MTRTRAPIESSRAKTAKRARPERGQQSARGSDEGKGERREEEGRDEGSFVLAADADDVLLSEELQIQEVILMTMRSEKEWEDSALETPRGKNPFFFLFVEEKRENQNCFITVYIFV